MNLIQNTSELNEFCNRLSGLPFITVDFEFLREHSYYAKLCLIQIGSETECAIVDPLAEGIDLSSFFSLMQNPDIIKVFHSGRQDIEIIYNLTGQIPDPLFDTQVAAMVAGFGESISYENLVKNILKISLDKSSRLSDWSKRPLNDRQLEYALSDVTHLVGIYKHLRNTLEKMHRTHWIDEEMETLKKPSTYAVLPREAWMRIHHRSHNPRFLTLLRELAAWREERSQRCNTPRQSNIKDDMLLTICSVCPQNKEELIGIRSLRKDIVSGKLGDEIIAVLQHANELPEEEYVTPPPLEDLPRRSSALQELLKLLLKIVSQENKVVPRLIASDEDLYNLSIFNDENNPLLQGWRHKLFGAKALQLRNGELTVGYNPIRRRIEFGSKKAPTSNTGA